MRTAADDAHFHRNGYATFLSFGGEERRFVGIHPWETEASDFDAVARLAAVAAAVRDDPSVGVGEIGLDRLRERTVSEVQRRTFAAQLALAAEGGRGVVLHGAKCWGEVVRACRPHAGRIPAFLFHGFSRSGGLVPDIVRLNGYFGVGKAILNDHAVNYRELVRALPADRILVETDAEDDAVRPETVRAVAAAVERLTGCAPSRLAENLSAFVRALSEQKGAERTPRLRFLQRALQGGE